MSDVKKVLRVGVTNNFNFTEQETEAVKRLGWDGPVFVNSNSFVSVKSDFPSFLTVNPYLTEFIKPHGDISNVRACRIKYVSDAVPKVRQAFVEALEWCLSNRIPVLITFMRFICRKSLHEYVQEGGELNYAFISGYWRLKPDHKVAASEHIRSIAVHKRLDDAVGLIHYCDMSGDGCPTCGSCARLAFGIEDEAFEMYGVSLSSSGDRGKCIFNCPDCWAKRLASFRPQAYDKVTQNSKQRGYNVKNNKIKEISKKLSKTH